MRQNTIHQSLQEKMMIAGIDEKLFVALWIITVAMAVVGGMIFMIPVSIFIHLFLRWVFKGDENMLEIYLAYREVADVYDPWPRVDGARKRPEGFGRDLLC